MTFVIPVPGPLAYAVGGINELVSRVRGRPEELSVDKIRDALRDVASNEARQELLDRWRNKGTVQCFSWIEPLMRKEVVSGLANRLTRS